MLRFNKLYTLVLFELNVSFYVSCLLLRLYSVFNFNRLSLNSVDNIFTRLFIPTCDLCSFLSCRVVSLSPICLLGLFFKVWFFTLLVLNFWVTELRSRVISFVTFYSHLNLYIVVFNKLNLLCLIFLKNFFLSRTPCTPRHGFTDCTYGNFSVLLFSLSLPHIFMNFFVTGFWRVQTIFYVSMLKFFELPGVYLIYVSLNTSRCIIDFQLFISISFLTLSLVLFLLCKYIPLF